MEGVGERAFLLLTITALLKATALPLSKFKFLETRNRPLIVKNLKQKKEGGDNFPL